MSGYLVDTNTLSEYSKPFPNGGVMDWFQHADPKTLFASVVTFGEIRRGIEAMPAGRRRNDIEMWFRSGLPRWFDQNLLPVDRDVADRWGRLAIEAKQIGLTLATADGLIAATAVEHDLTLVTRNVKDFAGLGIQIICPWT